MVDVQKLILKCKQQIILIYYMAESEFETICKLGKGSYGEVYKVRRRSDKREYALKKVKMVGLKQKDKRNTLNQVRILASVDHPNIIQYRQALFDENKGELALIMQLAQGGDLAQKIKTRFNRAQTFSEGQIWRWGTGILEGLQCLHQMGVVHRDIKPANILFTVEDVPLIGDLNVARELTQGLAHSQTGTPNYASPEIWDNQSYGAQCDIWSFGCIVYELCTYRAPFRSKNFDQLYQKVQSLHYDPIPSRYSINLENTIQKCLQKKDKRIRLQDLLAIFRRRSSQKEIKRSCSTGSLLKNINIPSNIKNISTVLPSSRYTKKNENTKKTEVTANPEQEQNQKNTFILDRYLKQKNPLLSKLHKARALNNRIYADQKEIILYPCRSQLFLKERQKQKKEEQIKLRSFKEVLDSLQEVKVSDRLAKLGLRKRNIRYGLKLY